MRQIITSKRFKKPNTNELCHFSIQLPQNSVCIQTDGATLCQLCQLAERTPTVAEREHSSFLPRNLDWEESDMLWTCQAPWALQKESVVFVLIFMNECRERRMNHDFCSELARRQQPDPRTYTLNVCLHSLPSSYKATRRDTQTRRKMCRVKIRLYEVCGYVSV